MDGTRPGTHTCDIPDELFSEIVESERLARRYFAAFRDGAMERMRELIHPEVVLVVKTLQPGHILRGKDEFIRFYEQQIARRLYEPVAEEFRPLDDSRVIVEGRVRWIDDERVLRDDPRIWAIEFHDGLLRRSTPAQTVLEAEAILSVPADER